jgi:hypothetical protein
MKPYALFANYTVTPLPPICLTYLAVVKSPFFKAVLFVFAFSRRENYPLPIYVTEIDFPIKYF